MSQLFTLYRGSTRVHRPVIVRHAKQIHGQASTVCAVELDYLKEYDMIILKQLLLCHAM